MPTAWRVGSSCGWRASKPLARNASRTVAPTGTVRLTSSARPSAGLQATVTASPIDASAGAIDLLRAAHEGIDERVGDAVEDRADQRLERAVGERIAQLELDLACLRFVVSRLPQRDETPRAVEQRERAVDQTDVHRLIRGVRVAG